jgi:hypothetical protein
MKSSILDFVPPGVELRPEQRALLLEIEARWDTHDVFSVVAPTAVGKTLLMVVIAAFANARKLSANILEPENTLVDQTQARYPHLKTLHRRDFYTCAKMEMTCGAHKDTIGKFCEGCTYRAARLSAKHAKTRLMNYYVYWSQRLYADVLMFDEGHRLLEMLQDKQDVRLWQKQYGFPTDLKTVADVILWAQEYLKTHEDAKLQSSLREIVRIKDGAAVVYKPSTYKRKPSLALHVVPTSTKSLPPWLWPERAVRKILLLSATISKYDVEELGLADRRVAYLECGSPIPARNRPTRYEPAYNLSYNCIDKAMPYVALKVAELLSKHPEKGLVHLPYGLARKLAERMQHPRLMYHDKENKAAVLQAFRDSPPSDGKVLVASGLYEGIDLPYDAARWQLIGKVPFLSLADPRTAAKAKEHPEWYVWNAVKYILQATGRIVRAPDDQGTTYIADANFGRLWDEDKKRKTPLFPQYFKDALQDLRRR